MRFRSIFAVAIALLVSVLVVGHLPAMAQSSKAECTVLTCAKCDSICKPTCDAELKACTEKTNGRRCPYNYRSCLKACPSMLCAQCLPVQHGSGGKKFLPGKTELCRTPGRNE